MRNGNYLKNDNIICIGDLVQKTGAEMLGTPNFGCDCAVTSFGGLRPG